MLSLSALVTSAMMSRVVSVFSVGYVASGQQQHCVAMHASVGSMQHIQSTAELRLQYLAGTHTQHKRTAELPIECSNIPHCRSSSSVGSRLP